MSDFPSSPVRMSRLTKNGALLGYGDYRVSIGSRVVCVHYPNGDIVAVEDVTAARWAVTLDVWHQLAA